jgi:hypothetical protein
MESKNNIYGCYMGPYQKMYRWQCKLFNDERLATDWALQGASEANTPVTLLVDIPKIFPQFSHQFFIEKLIRKRISLVDIHQD